MIFVKRLIIGLSLTVLGTGIFFNIASAQDVPMTAIQIEQIKSSCVSAKNTMAQLHANDALLRVNRGQMYESMTTKLMSRFNDRVDSNHQNSKGLTTVTQSYNAALTTFRIDYQSYEESLSAALKIDCTNEPVTFYDAVADARSKRTQVHVDVVKLHQYIDDYQAAFDTFATSFLHLSGGNN